jgi:hypothetical protein
MHITKRHLSINSKILQALIFIEMQIKPEQNLQLQFRQILGRYSEVRHVQFICIFFLFNEACND